MMIVCYIKLTNVSWFRFWNVLETPFLDLEPLYVCSKDPQKTTSNQNNQKMVENDRNRLNWRKHTQRLAEKYTPKIDAQEPAKDIGVEPELMLLKYIHIQKANCNAGSPMLSHRSRSSTRSQGKEVFHQRYCLASIFWYAVDLLYTKQQGNGMDCGQAIEQHVVSKAADIFASKLERWNVERNETASYLLFVLLDSCADPSVRLFLHRLDARLPKFAMLQQHVHPREWQHGKGAEVCKPQFKCKLAHKFSMVWYPEMILIHDCLWETSVFIWVPWFLDEGWLDTQLLVNALLCFSSAITCAFRHSIVATELQRKNTGRSTSSNHCLLSTDNTCVPQPIHLTIFSKWGLQTTTLPANT